LLFRITILFIKTIKKKKSLRQIFLSIYYKLLDCVRINCADQVNPNYISLKSLFFLAIFAKLLTFELVRVSKEIVNVQKFLTKRSVGQWSPHKRRVLNWVVHRSVGWGGAAMTSRYGRATYVRTSIAHQPALHMHNTEYHIPM
jgi:hypothetical protein